MRTVYRADLFASVSLKIFAGFSVHRATQTLRGRLSQSVSYFTVPPRAHPSTGSQSGSATPGLTQVLAPGGYSLSQVRSVSPSGQGIPCRFLPCTARAGLC